jgi:hypothetical protein
MQKTNVEDSKNHQLLYILKSRIFNPRPPKLTIPLKNMNL